MDKFKPALPVPQGVQTGQVAPSEVSKPLRDLAGADLLGEGRDFTYICRTCGAEVDEFLCNDALCLQRPEGDDWDWWLACSNALCADAWGEGWDPQYGHPEWVLRSDLVLQDRDPGPGSA